MKVYSSIYLTGLFHNIYYSGQSMPYLLNLQKYKKKARANLGQAQLKLELGFASTNLHQIGEQESIIILC